MQDNESELRIVLTEEGSGTSSATDPAQALRDELQRLKSQVQGLQSVTQPSSTVSQSQPSVSQSHGKGPLPADAEQASIMRAEWQVAIRVVREERDERLKAAKTIAEAEQQYRESVAERTQSLLRAEWEATIKAVKEERAERLHTLEIVAKAEKQYRDESAKLAVSAAKELQDRLQAYNSKLKESAAEYGDKLKQALSEYWKLEKEFQKKAAEDKKTAAKELQDRLVAYNAKLKEEEDSKQKMSAQAARRDYNASVTRQKALDERDKRNPLIKPTFVGKDAKANQAAWDKFQEELKEKSQAQQTSNFAGLASRLATSFGFPGFGRVLRRAGTQLPKLSSKGQKPTTVAPLSGAEKVFSALASVAPAYFGASIAVQAFASHMNRTTQNFEELGSATKSLASGDNMGALTQATSAAGSVMGRIPLVGSLLEASLKQFATGLNAIYGVIDSFVRRGQELSVYSPQLATASARSEVTGILADIKESQALGTQVSRLTDAKTDFDLALREALLPIKQFLIEKLARWMEGATQFVTDAAKWFEEVIANLKIVAATLLHPLDEAKRVEKINQVLGHLADRLAALDDPLGGVNGIDPIADLIGPRGPVRGRRVPPPLTPPQFGGRPGMPAFNLP